MIMVFVSDKTHHVVKSCLPLRYVRCVFVNELTAPLNLTIWLHTAKLCIQWRNGNLFQPGEMLYPLHVKDIFISHNVLHCLVITSDRRKSCHSFSCLFSHVYSDLMPECNDCYTVHIWTPFPLCGQASVVSDCGVGLRPCHTADISMASVHNACACICGKWHIIRSLNRVLCT